MGQRPFVLTGAAVLGAARRMLEHSLAAWCEDWGVAREELVFECLRAWEGAPQMPAAPLWRQPWKRDGASLALAWPAELPVQLQRLLFVPDRHYTPGAGVAHSAIAGAQAAWRDLQQRLAATALPQGIEAATAAPPAADDWAYASGALLLVLRFGKQVCYGVLNHDAVRAMASGTAMAGGEAARSGPPLPALDYGALLASLPVRLPVEIGRAQVDLGSLVSLGIGDVIRLNTAADRPLQVAGPSGAVLFGAYLGLSGDTVALEITHAAQQD